MTPLQLRRQKMVATLRAEGARAYAAGVSIYRCPFKTMHDAMQWRAGYVAAQQEKENGRNV